MIRALKHLAGKVVISQVQVFWLVVVMVVGCLTVSCKTGSAKPLTLSPSVITPSRTQTAASSPVSPTPTSATPTSPPVLLTPSQLPPSPTHHLTPTPWPQKNWRFPDSEVVYSPSAIDFDVQAYLDEAGGFLSTYRQYLMISDWNTGAQLVSQVALENSINPRLLLALLEYQSGCVLGQVEDPENFHTAMGVSEAIRLDLYGQLVWVVHTLSEGYYGWKNGTLTEFSLTDGTIIRPPLDSNAGSVALWYFFSQLNDAPWYRLALNPRLGFSALYEEMFGNPWDRAVLVEPLVPDGLEQPSLTLPFGVGKAWAYTGGPHHAFEGSGPLASLDFAPPTAETGCYQSEDWVLTMADGLVVRSEYGVVIQDLDGDGDEQTGWVLMYLHIEERDRVPPGSYLFAGDEVGHPSCEGGRATGTHVHIARKYNGEWIPADGLIPFVLDGWRAHAGELPYLGTLTRGDAVVTAHQYGSYISRISRDD